MILVPSTRTPKSISRAGAAQIAAGWEAQARRYAALAQDFGLSASQRNALRTDAEAAERNARTWAAKTRFVAA